MFKASTVSRSTMLKRHSSSLELLPHETMLKRHGPSVELLPHDVVELILERLPVKFLLRYKCVCKKWKSTIESLRFMGRQLDRRKQERSEDVLYVCLMEDDDEVPMRTIVMGSSMIYKVKLPIVSSEIAYGSCDGLLFLSSAYKPNYLLNPATRWYRSFPQCGFQQLRIDKLKKRCKNIPYSMCGFGKDKLRGTYKPVWLYNSSDFGLANVTTCEVFDFSTNAWRYLLPASPCRIISCHKPVYLDGSLYWFTECQETKVLSLCLHTETFQVISKTPFTRVRDSSDVIMCVLDNRLSVSQKNWPTQVIWSLHSSSGTWQKLCSLDLTKTLSWFGEPEFALIPVAILEENKLLLHARGFIQYLNPLVVYDLHTKAYDLLYNPTTLGHFNCYFQSLFSVLSD